MKYLNISAYQFRNLAIEALPQLRYHLKEKALALKLKGTILLSSEGMNLFLAGLPAAIAQFQAFLKSETEFKNLTYKDSYSEEQPFTRMLVRIKQEIIAFGQTEIAPACEAAPYVEPEQLKRWYDEGK